MVIVREGARIARTARVRLACEAAIFDSERRILLTKRKDNGRWCVPGGVVEPGESVTECCEREVLEETGLIVRATKLIAVYSSPDRISEYSDTDKWHVVALRFAAEIIGGKLRVSAETTDAAFFTHDEAGAKDMLAERLADSFAGLTTTIIR